MTVALANGEDLWAFRHASDDTPPSLYYSAPEARLRDSSGEHTTLEPGSALVVSEPLDRDPENWIEVEPESRVSLQGEKIRVESLF